MKNIRRKFDILYHLQEPDDFEPVDNCITSVLGQEVELTDEFKANYEKWLDREVFGTNIQWEQLLGKTLILLIIFGCCLFDARKTIDKNCQFNLILDDIGHIENIDRNIAVQGASLQSEGLDMLHHNGQAEQVTTI